jgi:hypothetical protein
MKRNKKKTRAWDGIVNDISMPEEHKLNVVIEEIEQLLMPYQHEVDVVIGKKNGNISSLALNIKIINLK